MDPAPPASCPRCRQVPLDDQPLIRHCSRCKGSWISEDTLHERVAAARGPRPGLAWHREARAALMCAICAAPMEALVVADTAIDRCARHGVWLDANELARVLAAAAAVAPPAGAAADPARAAISTEIAAEVAGAGVDLAIEAADVADVADAGGGVFEVVIGGVGFVAEVVVDAVAGIFSALD
jgi:Zn-finger nucleic acid-binding protein